MNSDVFKGQWKQLKGDIKMRWNKLTDDDHQFDLRSSVAVCRFGSHVNFDSAPEVVNAATFREVARISPAAKVRQRADAIGDFKPFFENDRRHG